MVVKPPDLGYDAAESYGIAYKARGLCNDHTNLDIYDDDNGLDYGVQGDIYRSDLHHNVSILEAIEAKASPVRLRCTYCF